jgi:hypothetical protein
MVVRFVCVVRVPLCARVSRVSRVCPGSPGHVAFPNLLGGGSYRIRILMYSDVSGDAYLRIKLPPAPLRKQEF